MDILAVKRRLMMFLDNNEELVKMYLDRFGVELSMPNIKAIREMTAPDQEKAEPGEDPLYTIKVQCPVCKNRDIQAWELRSKSQVTVLDPFMMPIYSSAGDYRKVNYPHYAVTVCPKCYFASPDKKDFNVWSRTRNEFQKSNMSPSIIVELIHNMGVRQSLAEEFDTTANPLLKVRNYSGAINSYRLAIKRVETEITFGVNSATYKKANYWLKIALIQRLNNLNFDESLNLARETLQTTYLKTDFPNAEHEYQGTYVLSALELYFKNNKLCREYQSSLDRIKSELNAVNSPNLNSCLKWINKCKRLWDDRNREDLWDLPK
tara:strand:+ start:891 stop:1850 length:960 start_codon:yes stop_codon:yes gene_type:complete